MDYLKEYAAALGGTATALIVVGAFGKIIIEHWFTKALKRYETELEDKAAKSKARFEQSHPEQAKIVLEVYTTCVETDQLLQMFNVYKGIARHDKGHAAGELVKMHDEITTKMILVEDQLSKRIYFQPALIELLEAFKKNTMYVFEDTTDGVLEKCLATSKTLMAGIEQHVKATLGLSD